ncbi:MAG: hypothetical protein HRT88_18895 [Lentisphaeraceae bacterium]|nr:hypothetical protein [Lentisphaeraceae bacterium]
MKKIALVLFALIASATAEVKTIDAAKGIQKVSFETETGSAVDFDRLRRNGYTLQFRFDDELLKLKDLQDSSLIVARRIGQEHQDASITVVARKDGNKINFKENLTGLAVDSVTAAPAISEKVLDYYKNVPRWESKTVSASDTPSKIYNNKKMSLAEAQTNALLQCKAKLAKMDSHKGWKVTDAEQVDVEWQTLYSKTSCGKICKVASSPEVTVKATFKRKWYAKEAVYKTVNKAGKRFW